MSFCRCAKTVFARGKSRARQGSLPVAKVDDSLNGAVLALGDETAGYSPDGNRRRAGANARPEIGQWLSKDGSETGHRLDRARRGEDAGGRVRVQTRSRSSVLRSD